MIEWERKDMQMLSGEIRSTKPIIGYPFIRASMPTALKMMDYFETPEFAILLVTVRGSAGGFP